MEQELHDTIFNAGVERLGKIIADYPWFAAARIYNAALGERQDEMLALSLLTRPWPAVLLKDAPTEVAHKKIGCGKRTDDGIIERFLATGGSKKVVPDETTPEDDVSESSSVFVPDEDMDTGELARIYRQQGLDRMADEVTELVEESIPEEI